jgi:hypothetical protein
MADKSGLDRREFLRRAAVTTAAAAWAAPVIQTVAASPAFASTNGTPAPGGCFHSVGGDTGEGCMGACTSSGCTGDACDGFGDPDGPCATLCNISPGNQCCNPGLCVPANFTCVNGVAVYGGSLEGCPTA